MWLMHILNDIPTNKREKAQWNIMDKDTKGRPRNGLLTTNKGWVSSTGEVRDIQPVLLSGVSKGAPFGTRLCLQSVVCYTRWRRCCENAVATREGKGIWNGRKTGLWLRGVEPQAQDWFHQQTGRIWKPRPSSYAGLWDKVSQSDSHTHEKADGLSSQNRNGRESHFRAFPPWLPISKDGRDWQRRRMKCAVHLDRWLARLALLFLR